MGKPTKQPEPKLTEVRLRKEIASLLNTTAMWHEQHLDGTTAYCMLREGMWGLLKAREPERREVVTLSSTEAEQISGALDSEGKEHPELKKLLSGHEGEEHW